MKKVVVIIDRDQYEHRALDPGIEIEVRDYNTGRDCDDCGEFVAWGNEFTKSIQHFRGDEGCEGDEGDRRLVYYLCPKCAEGRGISKQWIYLKREGVLREMLSHWHTDALDYVVHELKSEEAAEINNGGLDSQLEFLAGVGWKPQGGK